MRIGINGKAHRRFTFMDPLHGLVAPLDVHCLTLGQAVRVVTERVRDLTRQFHLFLHRWMGRRVEARRREHLPLCHVTNASNQQKERSSNIVIRI